MELMLRCAVPDRPGMLASVTGAISAVGGDIQAIEVVEHRDGRALDDLELRLAEERVPSLLQRLSLLDDVRVIHAGPSRGRPGDAVTRLAIGLEALLDGSAEPRRGLLTLVGGLLRARSAGFVKPDEVPDEAHRVLALEVDDEVLVLHRDYRFTEAERERAEALLRVARRTIATAAREVGQH